MTLAGVRALREADLILLPRKGKAKSDLVDLRRLLCRNLLDEAAQSRVVEFDLPHRERRDDYLAQWTTGMRRLPRCGVSR